jgi:chemotaxis-related protein WspB
VATLAVIWRSAGLVLAIDAASVIEVVPPLAWRPAPGLPDFVRGLFMYRGQLTPLVDASRLLESEPAPDRMMNRVLVLRMPGHGDTPPCQVGLWVECVLDLERIDFHAPDHHPGFATEGCRFLGPVTQTRWGLVQLVEPRELFTAEQVAVLTQRLAEEAV